MAIARLSLGRGAAWIRIAVGMVMDRPGPWIGGFAATYGASLAFSFIPIVGPVLSNFVNFAMSLFFICFADAQRKGVAFDFDAYVAQSRPVLLRLILMPLITIGLLILSAGPLIGGIIAAGGDAFITAQAKGEPLQTTTILLVAAGGLISAIMAVWSLSATWLATPQILLQKQTIGGAMRNSFNAVSSNILPLFVYVASLLVFFAACCLPLLLGLFIAIPASTITIYLAYEEILGKPDPV